MSGASARPLSGASVRPINTGGTPACLSGTYLALDAKTYAITIQTSMVPITTEELPDPELFQDYPLYVTRAKEDGQTRYRLRLGTFDNLAKAETLMPALRLNFPAAWANELTPDERRTSSAVKHWRGNSILPRAPIADSDSPSNVTEVRPVAAQPPPIVPAPAHAPKPIEEAFRAKAPVEELAPPKPALPEIKRHSLRPVARPEVEEFEGIEHEIDLDLPEPESEPEPRESLIAKALERNNRREKAKDRRRKQLRIDFDDRRTNIEDRRKNDDLSVEAKDRLLQEELLKQAKERGLRHEMMETAEPGTLLKAGDGICAFALNLGWSQQPLNRENLPGLVIFDKHYLYAVRTVHDGEIWYGLRLGFFPTRQRAEQLTHVLSKHFESVLVIPVRSEEFLASAELAVPSLTGGAEGASQEAVGAAAASTEPVALRARPGLSQEIFEEDEDFETGVGDAKPSRPSSVSRIIRFATRPLVLLTVLLCVLAGSALYQILAL